MKISEFQQLTNLQRDILIPISISGRNLKVTLGQILDEAAKAIVSFGKVQDRPASVNIVAGSDSFKNNAGMVVFDTTDKRFYLAVQNTASGSGQTIQSWTYYRAWDGSWQFFDSTGAVRKDAIFSDSTGKFYTFNGSALIRAGISQEEANLIELSKWVKIDSEEDMERLIAAGLAGDGKIRYIPEDD